MISAEDQALLDKYKDEVAKFRTFCLTHGDNGMFEEIDFKDLSLGFFIALDVTGDSGTGDLFYDAHCLASITRYSLQYWEGESL